jgi:two-component system chemotaxis response regulator CheY
MKDAASALGEKRFDAILLDYKLDTRTGVDLLRLLRGSDKTPNRKTPVLMLTGQTRQDIVDEATQAGVDAFILKPVMPDVLGWRVLEAVSQVREREISDVRRQA